MSEHASQPSARRSVVVLLRWPVVLIVAILAAAGVLVVREWSPSRVVETGGKAVAAVARRGAEAWRDLSRAELDRRSSQFVAGIPTTADDLSLVVATLDMTEDVVEENTKRQFGINFGTTKVTISVPARIHYGVPLDGRKPVTFEEDVDARTFTAVFPRPTVQAVEIFSADKQSVVEVGWGRLKALSGRALEEKIDRRLYEEIRREAGSAAARALVNDRARKKLARFVALYLRTTGAWDTDDGFEHLVVRFVGEEPAAVAPVDRRALRAAPAAAAPTQPLKPMR